MRENSTRDQLAARRREIYAAIRVLQRDVDEGNLDRDAYDRARRRYESEAAQLLQQEEISSPESSVSSSHRVRLNRTLLLGSGAFVVVVAAIALLLVSALRARTGSAAITGDVGQATPVAHVPSVALVAAQDAVRAHPRDPVKQLALAKALVDSGNSALADAAYRRAVQLAPERPETRTLYAMFKGAEGSTGVALGQLDVVERDTPAYARAWLVDGLLASRMRSGLPRAVHAWRRFLQLSPHATVAQQVRSLLRSALSVEKKGS